MGAIRLAMKFLAIERDIPDVKAEQFQPFLKAEAQQAWELYQAGTLRELYFRGDCSEAVLILECTSLTEAQLALASLPLVKAGLIIFDLFPLVPYPGFSRLFAEKG